METRLRARTTKRVWTSLLVVLTLATTLWSGTWARAQATKAQVDRLSVALPTAANVETEQTGNGQRLHVDGFDGWMQPAEPMLPYRTLRVLLPADVDLTSVTVELSGGRWVDLAGMYDVAPAPPLATEGPDGSILSWGDASLDQLDNGRSRLVYDTDSYWPTQPVRLAGAGAYRQWRYAELAFFPLQYNAASGALRRLEGGVAVVRFARWADGSTLVLAPTEERFWSRLASELVNPSDRAAFYPALNVRPATDMGVSAVNDYVVITTAAIRSGSSQLAAFLRAKERQGFSVKVVTEAPAADDTHYQTGAGADARANNIRSWLANRYLSEGIEYVLLIGDPHPTVFSVSNSVPMKMTYPRSAASSYRESPTDMYYSDLTGNWNPDGDALFGEYAEVGVAGGIDRTPEVYVGRIPFYGSFANLDAILSKTIAYGEATGDLSWRQKLLAPAAISNHGPQDNNGDGVVDYYVDYPLYFRTFGADWGEHLKTLAVGNGYSAYTLYEKTGVYSDGSAYPLTTSNAALNTSNLLTEWAKGYGFVSWWGHGNSTGAYRRSWTSDAAPPNPYDRITQLGSETVDTAFITTNDLGALSNSRPAFVAQVSCSNGQPEDTNNLGYALLRQGAIGAFSASRVSWYFLGAWSPMNYADNASFAYYLFQRMSAMGESAGQALANVRGSLSLANTAELWMNCTDHNLYGDPALGLSSRAEACAVPPLEPHAPSPADGAESVATDVQLAWCGGHVCEGVPVMYDVYLKADDPTPDELVCHDLTTTTCNPGALAKGQTYYWQVVAKGPDGTTPGPIWQLSTIAPLAGVTVSEALPQAVGLGEEAVFHHVMTNTGNGSDTFDISHAAALGWVVEHPASLQVAAGATTALTVRVTPPPETPSGVEAQIVVTVTSRLQSSAFAEALDVVRVELPSTATVVMPDAEAFLTDEQGLEIAAPAGAVAQPVTLVLTPLADAPHPLSQALGFAGMAFRLEAYRGGQRLADLSFDMPLEVTLFYDNNALGSLEDESLDLYRWSGQQWQIAACGATERHLGEDWLTVPVCQTGEFALAGPKPTSGQRYYHMPVLRRQP